MSHARHRTVLAAALLGLRSAAVLGGESGDTAGRIDISVLTPAVEGKFHVVTGLNPSIFLIPVPFAQLGDRTRSTELRALVARERYDPVKPFADRLIDAMTENGYHVALEPIKRKTPGSIQTLAWSDLPDNPRGEVMLDVTIRWLCLCSEVAYAKYYPAIALGWRVLGEREIIEPTHELVHRHFPPGPMKKKPPPRRATRRKLAPGPATEPEPEPEPAYPVTVVSKNCGFDYIKAATENPIVVWGCFAESYEAAIARLVIDLKRVYPPRVVPVLKATSTSRGTPRIRLRRPGRSRSPRIRSGIPRSSCPRRARP